MKEVQNHVKVLSDHSNLMRVNVGPNFVILPETPSEAN